jgi:hypothetical protein
VFYLLSSIFGAETHGRRAVRTPAHILGPAGDGHLGIAEHDRLSARDDRLQAAAAEPVQSQGGRLVGQTAIDACYPRQVMVVGIGVNDVAENDVTDVFHIDSGAGDSFPHTRCGHLTGRGILQAAAVRADCRPNSAKNYNFSIHIKLGRNVVLLLNNWFRPPLPTHRPVFASSLVSLSYELNKSGCQKSALPRLPDPNHPLLCQAPRSWCSERRGYHAADHFAASYTGRFPGRLRKVAVA